MRELPEEPFTHRLFEAQAACTPDATALIFGDVRLSYREVNERATKIAGALRRRNLGRGALVAVVLQRSPEMLIGLLAVLKAGAAYLPLDPAHPDSRIAGVLAERRRRAA